MALKPFQYLHQLIHHRDGALTRDLVQSPGRFGLGRVPERLAPDSTATLVCGYCSTGCGLKAHLRNGQAVNLSADSEYPVNLGMACPKGWEALTPLKASDRATQPRMRDAAGTMQDVDWNTAMQSFTHTFKDLIQRHGPESVAFLSTGQIPMEEMFFLGCLAKFGMGLIHGDANTRQCMSTSHVAYKESFGFDAPPFSYKDFEESDVLVFIGANPCIAHPILWERVCLNPHNPRIVVVDPRRTETAMAATRHFAIAPKSDLALLYGLAHILLAEGWLDRDYIASHTNGFPEFTEHLQAFSPTIVAGLTGLSEEDLREFAAVIHAGKRVSFWWTMGVNQSHEGVRTAQAIINLALMTGNMGRPGTGANSITGQVNAMGSRLYSNTTSMVGGHDFLNPEHRKKIAGILAIEEERIPTQKSLPYDQIIQAVKEGRIKGLWVIATNPAHSWIDQEDFRRVMGNLEFLVVQDMYGTTETANLAHLILPSAGWGEKEGVVINSERRLGLFKKISKAPGSALADFYIFKLMAKYWGCGDMFRKWTRPEDVFQSIKEVSRGQPCDITGIHDYAMIDRLGGVQWPYAEGEGMADPAPDRRLFEDGRYYHDDSKARFIFDSPKPLPETVTEEYPLVLLTGRGTSAQWHTNTRTAKSPVLRKLYPKDCYVELHPDDANRLRIKPGQWVRVSSRRGEIKARAFVASTVQVGQIFIPMHYDGVNRLTHPAFDPHSRQPSYKYCAVRIESASSSPADG